MKKKLDDGKNKGEPWFYSEKVKEHFFHPKNLITDEEIKKFKADGVGIVGSMQCGDSMKMFIKVKNNIITDCKFQTYGCATAISSTSIFTEMVKGKTIEEALKITPKDIVRALGGIPERKFHCSVLADKSFREAVNDYHKKTKQFNKISSPSEKIIDKVLKITDKDIEEAVLNGALTFEDVQKKTKVGIHDKECIEEVKQLINFYRRKYYGPN